VHKSNPKFKAYLKNRNKRRERRYSLQLHRARRKNHRSQRGENCNNETIKTIDKYHKMATAPENFSIKDNPEETMNYFKDILSFMKQEKSKKNIEIDLHRVKAVTADAIIYLIAFLHSVKTHHSLSGNVPYDKEARGFIEKVGFANFVNTNGAEIPRHDTTDFVQIKHGRRVQENIAKEICLFVHSKTTLQRIDTKFLFEIITEMMSNTFNHAYRDNSRNIPNWYIYAERKNNLIDFVFLDTGLSIPSTVKRKFKERFFANESRLVSSALNGEFRTSSGEFFRGNGLPKIKKSVEEHQLEEVYVISNKAFCELKYYEKNVIEKEQKRGIMGTMYCWQIKIKEDIK
jgi:hypothetical protein